MQEPSVIQETNMFLQGWEEVNLEQDSSSRPHLQKCDHIPCEIVFIWALKKIEQLLLSALRVRIVFPAALSKEDARGLVWLCFFFFPGWKGSFLHNFTQAKLHAEQFIYPVLSHTCLDMGCFLVFKHTISCQLLYLQRPMVLWQMFLINSKKKHQSLHEHY